MPNPIKLTSWVEVVVAPGADARVAHSLRINSELVQPRYVAYGADFTGCNTCTLSAAASQTFGVAAPGVLWDATYLYFRNAGAATTAGHVYVGRRKSDDEPNTPPDVNL